MFWIIGGRELLWAFSVLMFGRVPGPISYHTTHPEWEGFAAWDLIMPLFLFLVGAVIPFSLDEKNEGNEKRTAAYVRILRRVFLLWLLGLIYEGTLARAVFAADIFEVDLYTGTLHAIAVGYFFVAILVLNTNRLAQASALVCLLVVYGLAEASYALYLSTDIAISPVNSLASEIDRMVLGRFDDDTTFTWVFSSIGFTSTVLLGVFAGYILRSGNTPSRNLAMLLLAGVSLLLLATALSPWLPVVRRAWSATMVLWAGGWSFLLLGVFYFLADMRGHRKYLFPFTVIGANAILAYMLGEQWVQTWNRLFGVERGVILEGVGAAIALTTLWGLLFVMHRQRLFLRV
jgi:predicted acyltransferase